MAKKNTRKINMDSNESRKAIHQYMNQIPTQVKASRMLTALNNEKDNDYEAMAIMLMVIETLRNLPAKKEDKNAK